MSAPLGSEPDGELARRLRESMSRLAGGVVLVTCLVDGRPWGLTVTACCSISADPPVVLISLTAITASAVAIREQGRFGVSILGATDLEVARFGGAPGRSKFIDAYCAAAGPGAATTPAVATALAHLDGVVGETLEANDHVLFFGQVTRVDGGEVPPGPPLVHYGRQFYDLSTAAPA